MSARDGDPAPEGVSTISGEDWYGHEFGAAEYSGVRFVDLDLTEATSFGAIFTNCTFVNVKFNARVTSAQAVEIARGLGLIVDEG